VPQVARQQRNHGGDHQDDRHQHEAARREARMLGEDDREHEPCHRDDENRRRQRPQAAHVMREDEGGKARRKDQVGGLGEPVAVGIRIERHRARQFGKRVHRHPDQQKRRHEQDAAHPQIGIKAGIQTGTDSRRRLGQVRSICCSATHSARTSALKDV
jgi:hypothetical protein